MVVFTCNHCGDSLQKPKVEKHYQIRCRIPKNLTCIDCLKDFLNEDYVAHVKCISEDARYSAKGTPADNFTKKGEVKQESWIDMIHSIVNNQTNIKPHLKDLLNGLLQFSNVPRKKAKFVNFMKSSNAYRVKEVDILAVWDIIEEHKNQTAGKSSDETKIKLDSPVTGETEEKPKKKKQKDEIAENGQSNGKMQPESGKIKKKKNKAAKVIDGAELEKPSINVNEMEENSKESSKRKLEVPVSDKTEEETAQKKKKKKKLAETDENEQSSEKIQPDGNEHRNGKIKNKNNVIQEMGDADAKDQNVSGSIETVEQESTGKFDYKEKINEILEQKSSIPLDKLRKKIIKFYTKEVGGVVDPDKILKKVRKSLKKMPQVEVENDLVKLIKQ